MFDPDSDTDHLPADAAIADVTGLIRLISDPKASQRRLDQIVAAEARLKEETASAERADKARAAALDAREAAVAEKENEVTALEQCWKGRMAALDAREAELSVDNRERRMNEIRREVSSRETRLRSSLLSISGLGAHYSGLLQDLPSFDQLIEEILHDHASQLAGTGASFNEPVAGDRETIPVEDLMAGSTLTRSVDKPRRGADRH